MRVRTTGKPRHRPGTPAVRLAVAGAVALLALVGAGPAASAAEGQPTAVNGTMAQPQAPKDGLAGGAAPAFWEGRGDLYSTGLAKHPSYYQAFDLNDGAAGYLTQTLQNIRSGAVITLRWDDSPNRYEGNTAQRRYEVSATGGTAKEFTTLSGTTVGTPWRNTNTYRFTASGDNPILRFTSLETGALGALVSNVRVDQDSAPTDTPAPAVPTAGTPAPERPAIPSGDKPPVADSDACVPFVDGSLPDGCTAQTANQQAIDACPPGSAPCVAKYATDGTATKQDTASTSALVNSIVNKDRYSDPKTAAGQMCAISAQHTGAYRPDQYEYDPRTWNCRPGLSDQDGEQTRPTPGGTLTPLPTP
ncbi:hypothetical protein [Kitasatospora sp. NPDC059327]|uniref:hypothetical protein n=1 Tax=Kitasatospora sp. NPDC059327 TaxID=3346803 RepID=UPI003682E5DB